MRARELRAKWSYCVLLAAGLLVLGSTESALAKPLSEGDLATLLRVGIAEEDVLAKIQKDGIGFAADEEAISRLKEAGASDAVLAAVRAAKPAPAAGSTPPITYAQVLELLKIGIGEDAILKRLEQSPSVFTLDASQVDELKTAGASEKLLAAMQQTRKLSPQAAEMLTDVAIILDCSGSMREATKEGETKMAVAKRVVTDLVQKLPEDLNVAFIVYGHEVFGGAQDPRNCQAVKVVRSVSKLGSAGKQELGQAISRLRPVGATPISLALQTAGRELAKHDSYGGIVLVTDGKETCNGDPTAAAAALAANKKLSFGVNVVGFDVREDRASLEEIARKGHGKYYNADSAVELAQAISEIGQEVDRHVAPPKPVSINRRAVKVLKPGIEFPECKEIQLEIVDGILHTTVARGKLGEEIRVPSSTQAYHIVWVPVTGKEVSMLKDFKLAERKVVEIKPEEHLGMIRVSGNGTPKRGIAVWTRDGIVTTTWQECKKFGEIMVVPLGTYGVSVDGTTIEEGLKVDPGTLHALE